MMVQYNYFSVELVLLIGYATLCMQRANRLGGSLCFQVSKIVRQDREPKYGYAKNRFVLKKGNRDDSR